MSVFVIATGGSRQRVVTQPTRGMIPGPPDRAGYTFNTSIAVLCTHGERKVCKTHNANRTVSKTRPRPPAMREKVFMVRGREERRGCARKGCQTIRRWERSRDKREGHLTFADTNQQKKYAFLFIFYFIFIFIFSPTSSQTEVPQRESRGVSQHHLDAQRSAYFCTWRGGRAHFHTYLRTMSATCLQTQGAGG